MDIDEYDFLFNDDGELMLVLDGFDAEPQDPFVTLQDSQVLLTRSDKMPVLCMNGIPDDIWEKLETVPHVLVCEIDEDGAPSQVYDAPVKKTFNA